jgi:hypothetical protein
MFLSFRLFLKYLMYHLIRWYLKIRMSRLFHSIQKYLRYRLNLKYLKFR